MMGCTGHVTLSPERRREYSKEGTMPVCSFFRLWRELVTISESRPDGPDGQNASTGGNDIQTVRHRIRPEELGADIVRRPPT